MKKLTRRILSVLLAIAIITSIAPMAFSENKSTPDFSDNTATQISATNSFGTMLTNEADGDLLKETNKNNIFSLTFSDDKKTATVEYNVDKDCTVVIGIYKDNDTVSSKDSEKIQTPDMICYVEDEIYFDKEIKTVNMGDKLANQEYFIAKAFLIDEDNAPLCKSYTTIKYTKDFHDFYIKTPANFTGLPIIYFTDETIHEDAANFGVLKDNVKIIDNKGSNIDIQEIEKNETTTAYTLSNLSEDNLSTIKDLKKDSVLFIDNGNLSSLFIVKLSGEPTIKGSTATIICENDIDFEDAFEYIKIDDSREKNEMSFDKKNLPEGVEYIDPETNETENPEFHTDSIGRIKDFNDTVEADILSYNLPKLVGDDDSFSANATVNVSASCSYGIYFDSSILDIKGVDLVVNPVFKFIFELTINGEKTINLPEIVIVKAYGIEVKVCPEFTLKFSGTVTFEISFTFTIGFEISEGKDPINKCQPPKTDGPDLHFEGEASISFNLNPTVSIISDNFAGGQLGTEITLKLSGENDKHVDCMDNNISHCFVGNITAKIEITISATGGLKKLLDKVIKKSEYTIYSSPEIKLCDFYLCGIHEKFELKSCPYQKGKSIIKVYNENKKPLKGASVQIYRGKDYVNSKQTDEKGIAEFEEFCHDKYTLKVYKSGYASVNRDIKITIDKTDYAIYMNKSNSLNPGAGSDDSREFIQDQIVKFGSYPQTKVTDTELINELSKTINDNWISYQYHYKPDNATNGSVPSDFMIYQDLMYNNSKYRAVKFTEYRPTNTAINFSDTTTNQSVNGYLKNTVYFFKFEPLEWKVTDAASGELTCTSIIDSQSYNEYGNEEKYPPYHLKADPSNDNSYATHWDDCTLRNWLNESFYDTAFSESQKSLIKLTSLTTNGSDSTSNYVYIRTAKEAGWTYNYSQLPVLSGTDYSKCQGLLVESNGNSAWWVREKNNELYNKLVDSLGSSHASGLGEQKNTPFQPQYGVVPSIRVNTNRDITLGSFDYSTVMASENNESKTLTIKYEDCTPDSNYIIYELNDYKPDFRVLKNNLAYINQVTADSEGKIETSFTKSFSSNNTAVLVIGEFNGKTTSRLVAGTCGNNITYSYSFENKTLELSGTGNPKSYTSNSSPFSNEKSIETIVINEGITHISSYLFHNCENVETVYVPLSVSTVNNYAFRSCHLKEIYYAGSERNWNAIRIYKSGNGSISNANIHFGIAIDYDGIDSEFFGEFVVDKSTKFISNLNLGMTSDDFIAKVPENCSAKVINQFGDKIGTGSKITITYPDKTTATFTAIIYGDSNGDGIYDGMDSVIVSLIVNGMLTKEKTGNAIWEAADCNHDGVIDNADVEILQQAGLLLANIDQSKSTDELKTDSVYIEYTNLISQSQNSAVEQPKINIIALFEKFFNYFKNMFLYIFPFYNA